MILKIAGMILILFSTTTIGVYFSSIDKYRIEDLEELKKALTILKNQIGYSSMPLHEGFKEIAKRTEGAISNIMEKVSQSLEQKMGESAAKIWQSIWQTHKQSTYFSKEDIEMILSFGATLGYLDRQQQISSMEIAFLYINETQTKLKERLSKNARIYRSMGILTGLLMIIVLF